MSTQEVSFEAAPGEPSGITNEGNYEFELHSEEDYKQMIE